MVQTTINNSDNIPAGELSPYHERSQDRSDPSGVVWWGWVHSPRFRSLFEATQHWGYQTGTPPEFIYGIPGQKRMTTQTVSTAQSKLSPHVSSREPWKGRHHHPKTQPAQPPTRTTDDRSDPSGVVECEEVTFPQCHSTGGYQTGTPPEFMHGIPDKRG